MSTASGKLAEDAAATFLRSKGFVVIEQNWRTRWCEIDLIVSKSSLIYFVEVKYRSSTAWGSGIEYITPKKLQQMDIAARFWIANHSDICDYRLSAIELTDNPPQVTEWIEEIY